MYIESINIQSFGALSDFVFTPGAGVNVIEVAN